jgi:Na+-driven multidrug efflux pump
MSFISQNLGARNLSRIKKTAFISSALGSFTALILGAIMLLLYKPLCLLIRNDVAILEFAKIRMIYVGLFFFIGAFQNIFGHVLRGLGKSTTAMLISLFSGCILRIIWFEVVKVIFPNSLQAVLLSYSVTWAIGSILFLLIIIPTFNKLKQKFNNSALESDAQQN